MEKYLCVHMLSWYQVNKIENPVYLHIIILHIPIFLSFDYYINFERGGEGEGKGETDKQIVINFGIWGEVFMTGQRNLLPYILCHSPHSSQ